MPAAGFVNAVCILFAAEFLQRKFTPAVEEETTLVPIPKSGETVIVDLVFGRTPGGSLFLRPHQRELGRLTLSSGEEFFIVAALVKDFDAHAAAGWPEIGKILKAGTSVINGLGYAVGCCRVVPRNPFVNALQIFDGAQGPANLHQVCKSRSRRWPTCSWVRYSPRCNACLPRFTASMKRLSSSKYRATTSCTRCLVYLIVGSPRKEQSRQASYTAVRHERQPLIASSQNFANVVLPSILHADIL